MNMIEKVTKVISQLEACNPKCLHCQKIAKAAIEAMREPSEEMLNTNDPVVAIEMTKIYTTLIDAALKETK